MKFKICITFHTSYKYSTYQIIKDPCNEKYQYNILICEETRNMIIHQEKYIQVYIDYLIE